MLDLPRRYTPSIEQEEDDVEETILHDPNEQTQEVFTQSPQHTLKFGDNDHLIKASIIDVDCSG